ncbi:MAG TPA: tetratricopeptide repeat protein [Dongiaceae bacterium]|jgi:tetratricopeptide (TPR) repeat protein
MACHRRAVELSPASAEPYSNLANVLRQKGDLYQAANAGKRALELAPKNATICCGLAETMLAMGQTDEAVGLARRGLALSPHSPEAHYCLGLALTVKGDFEEGAAKLRRVVELRPANAVAHLSLGRALMALGDIRNAIAHLSTAQLRDPKLYQAQFALGAALLADGRLSDGWRHYEARLQHPEHIARIRLFSKPRWQGQEFKDKTLLLHAEQGLGDTIQMLRYLPLVASRGGNILLELQPELIGLAAANLGDLPVKPVSRGDPLPAYDFNCPMMSLPLAFGTQLASIPAAIPYIAVPGQARDSVPGRPRLGLAWAAGGSSEFAKKSLHLADFGFLAAIPGLDLVSLQKGARENEAAQPPPGLTLEQPALADFLHTAHIIAGLDLVISVDTAVAHLAGAMGKPVWLLLPHPAEWRWLTGRDDSPWYPTMRLFRQPQRGDWLVAFDKLAAALRERYSPGL